jgi:predicted deacetylase
VTALIVSLSGLSERNLPDCVSFAGELDSRLVPASWLLPPRPRDGRHLPDAPVIRWLRRRVEVGDALVLHGFDHTVDPIGRWATSGMAKIGRRAEFAALPSHEAALRLIAATRAMDELGLRSDVFAPPRWLASAGTVVALRQRGFRVCADSSGVRLLDPRGNHDRLLRGRVLNTGRPLNTGAALSAGGILSAGGVLGAGGVRTSGGVRTPPGARTSGGVPPEAADAWRYRALVASAARTARRGGLVRIAAEADELGRPAARQALLDAVDAALAADAHPATYRAPMPARAPLSA